MIINSEISRLTLVRQRANNLYNKYELSVPVDLNRIIEEKHIEIIHKENQVGIDGLCQLQKNPPTIILNTEITLEARRRFTIAHELGHICIPWHTGIDLCSIDEPYIRVKGQQMVNTQELEANTFASELLMPTNWLKENFDLNTKDLSGLVTQVCHKANTSIMACFYALENVLPAGDLFFVKTDAWEFWKPFKSVSTSGYSIPTVNVIPFYNEVCHWKLEFKLAHYTVIHYKIQPEPDDTLVNEVYQSCGSNFEEFLYVITGGRPISLMPYISKIINMLDEKFYVIVKVGDDYFRHFRHKETAIRMYSDLDEDIDGLYDYIKLNFLEYGKLDFSSNSCILWVKEHWRGGGSPTPTCDPHELLRIIVDELYPFSESQHMLQSINGAMANINSRYPKASKEQLYHYAKIRFETDPKYEAFAAHRCFEQYISGKAESLISKRKERAKNR